MGKVKYTTARINDLLDKVANRLSGSGTDDIDSLISGLKEQLADKADSETTTTAIEQLYDYVNEETEACASFAEAALSKSEANATEIRAIGTDIAAVRQDLGDKADSFYNSADIERKTVNTETPQGIRPIVGLHLTAEARHRLFCDLFNAAANPFGSGDPIGYARITDGAFDGELNGLPLTYEEAVLIYNVTNGAPAVGQCAGTAIRTNLWTVHPTYGSGASIDLLPPGIFANCYKAEVLRIHKGSDNIAWAGDWRNMFTGCSSLREIIGIIGDYAAHGSISPFTRCAKLEKLKIHRLNGNIVLADSPLIDLESLTYIVTYRGAGTNPITITVHPDVYAKLTDTDNTEWTALVGIAAEKNITFLSA